MVTVTGRGTTQGISKNISYNHHPPHTTKFQDQANYNDVADGVVWGVPIRSVVDSVDLE